MALTPINSDTGQTILPDIGSLRYNGVTFSHLYHSSVTGHEILDNAGWTVKGTEYTISVDGVVTLGPGDQTCDRVWVNLRKKLQQAGGALVYLGKGFGPLIVNQPGGAFKPAGTTLRDLAWGPRPELLEFIPLGGSRSANVKWVCKTLVSEQPVFAENPVVQFNYDTSMSYDEQGYSKLVVHGTIEIPLSRRRVDVRSVPESVDQFRNGLVAAVTEGIDLTRYRVTSRTFPVSRDRRTMEFEVTAEEMPLFGLPPGATAARGTFSCRPWSGSKYLAGTVKWLCSLRGTYVIANSFPRRQAWWAFLSLLYFRYNESRRGFIDEDGKTKDPLVPRPGGPQAPVPTDTGVVGGAPSWETYFKIMRTGWAQNSNANAFMTSFSFEEGLYLDARTITFEASWMLITSFTRILEATGCWFPCGIEGGDRWASKMASIQGPNSWLVNRFNADNDIIVDMGANP